MLSLFQRKRPPVAGAPPPAPATVLPKGLMRPESAASLLATPRRQKLLEHIWQRTSLSRKQFASLYRAPLERYAELVQAFPASEAHHHAYPGGMLDHGLEIVAYSLKLRQSHLLPIGASPEDQAAQAEAADLVRASGGDFEHALGLRLSANVREIGVSDRIDGVAGVGQARFQRTLPAQMGADVEQRARLQYAGVARQRRFTCAVFGQDKTALAVAGGEHHRQRAANRPQLAGE